MAKLTHPWICQDGNEVSNVYELPVIADPAPELPKKSINDWVDYAESQGRCMLREQLEIEAKAERQRLRKEIKDWREKARTKTHEELKQKRKKARSELCASLKQSRNVLRSYSWKIANAEAEAKRMVEEKARGARQYWRDKLLSARSRLQILNQEAKRVASGIAQPVVSEGRSAVYPSVPLPFSLIPSKEAYDIPDVPGIYFLWAGGTVDYVGKSVKLSSRLKLGNHHVLTLEHRMSYLLFEDYLLDWAECYYIGILQPLKNFGASASHWKRND